jgi:hypothetical protein
MNELHAAVVGDSIITQDEAKIEGRESKTSTSCFLAK